MRQRLGGGGVMAAGAADVGNASRYSSRTRSSLSKAILTKHATK